MAASFRSRGGASISLTIRDCVVRDPTDGGGGVEHNPVRLLEFRLPLKGRRPRPRDVGSMIVRRPSEWSRPFLSAESSKNELPSRLLTVARRAFGAETIIGPERLIQPLRSAG